MVRLRARGINLGYLSLFRTSRARPSYTRDDLHQTQDLADRAALAIDNSRLVEGLERRVAERTRALEAANRELEAFAFSVSHDLQSPLRAIDGFSSVLENRYGPNLDGEARRMLSVVRRNAQRMGATSSRTSCGCRGSVTARSSRSRRSTCARSSRPCSPASGRRPLSWRWTPASASFPRSLATPSCCGRSGPTCWRTP